MSVIRTSIARCAVPLLLAALGCGKNPQAQFQWRDSTTELIPNASKAVQKTIVDHFGTPDELVAWDKLPVHYSRVTGTLAEAGASAEQFRIAWDPGFAPAELPKNNQLLWLSGANAASQQNVVNVDAAGLVTLEAPPNIWAPGDRVAVNFGDRMQLGRVVYMKNCHHCHGVAGDGNGPTAKFLTPKPRDYRLGYFKFTSTNSMTIKPTRDDLRSVIKYGIPGTYMPSFLLMKDEEVTAVIEYVRWLAMRGEMEKRLDDELTADYSLASIDASVKKAKDSGEKGASKSQLLKQANDDLKQYLAEDYPTTVNDTAEMVAESWTSADDPANVVTPSVPRVADTAESRARGRMIYLSDKAKCYTCHGPHGRGDGAATEDFWPKPGSQEKYANRGLHDFWGNPLSPRDLTKGQYRGGRRPIDLFRRVHAGIKGTPMPAFGGTVLKDEDIWDVVNYVMSLPFEAQSPSKAPAKALATTAQVEQ